LIETAIEDSGTRFHNMRILAVAFGLLASTMPYVCATSLTYKLDASEKACFYTWVDNPPAKVAFYFAVRIRRHFLFCSFM
jgi:hypothetical protein